MRGKARGASVGDGAREPRGDRRRARSGRRARGPRPATVYVLVLATAAIATAAGIGGLYVQRTRLRMARSIAEMEAARVLAASGPDLALARIRANADWRTSIGGGTWLDSAALGQGTLTVEVTDPADGDLVDSDTDPIRITSTARVGGATQAVAADINFSATRYTALGTSAFAMGAVTLDKCNYAANAAIYSDQNMTGVVANVFAQAEARGTVLGLTFFGGSRSLAPARTGPPASIVGLWAARNTAVPSSNFSGNPPEIKQLLIYPGAPTGGVTPTADGVWVVNAMNRSLILKDLRIYGTVVIINAVDVILDTDVRIDPVVPGYPGLIVQGNLRLQIDSGTLDEGSGGRPNFNPAGAPWGGVTDTDTTDAYPNGASGIIFATGYITVEKPLTLTGTLISLNYLTVSAATNITQDVNVVNSTASGFSSLTPVLAPTGVGRVVR